VFYIIHQKNQPNIKAANNTKSRSRIDKKQSINLLHKTAKWQYLDNKLSIGGKDV
jgi:hypothetical protein